MSLSNFLFAVYDRKAQYYLPPFAARSDAEAERAFAEFVSTSDTPISQYPADFDLVRLGAIDLETGVLSSNHGGMPLLMVNGLTSLQAAHAQRSRYKQALAPYMPQEADVDASNGELHA